MPEFDLDNEIITYAVIYKCDELNCHGEVVNTGKLGKTAFEHKCDKCGKIYDLQLRYPTIKYKIKR